MTCHHPDTPTDALTAWVARLGGDLWDLPGFSEIHRAVQRAADAAGSDGLAWLESYILGNLGLDDAPMDSETAADLADLLNTAADKAIDP